MRESALDALAKLEPVALMEHDDLIMKMRASEHVEVRQWAVGLIDTLYTPGGVGARAAKDDFERASKRQRRQLSYG